MVNRQQTKVQGKEQIKTVQPTKPEDPLTGAQITPEAFNHLYEKTMQKFSYWTFEKIYEETERLVLEQFGRRKYASADSFRQIRKRIIKK